MSNLTFTSSISQSYVQTAKGRVAAVVLSISLTDSRPFVAVKPVGLSLDWGDGSQVELVNRSPSPYSNTFKHTYTPGNYILKVIGKNYQIPLADSAVATFDIAATTGNPKIPTLAEQGLQPIIFGPILPRDEGFPNKSEWAFQTSQDSVVLESSARLLLITTVGERLMQPEYGTKLPLMIFSPSSASLQDDINQEVIRAFSTHEPRLSVSGVNVTQLGQKEIKINVRLLSKLDQREFQVSSSFVKS
jgi:phage baseplate assembly protein W